MIPYCLVLMYKVTQSTIFFIIFHLCDPWTHLLLWTEDSFLDAAIEREFWREPAWLKNWLALLGSSEGGRKELGRKKTRGGTCLIWVEAQVLMGKWKEIILLTKLEANPKFDAWEYLKNWFFTIFLYGYITRELYKDSLLLWRRAEVCCFLFPQLLSSWKDAGWIFLAKKTGKREGLIAFLMQ